MKKSSFEVVANVKKFSTQGSKGGSIILTLEMPLTDDNCMLSAAQNKDCVVLIKFDNDSIEKAQGQKELDFNGPSQAILIKGRVDPDVNYRYIDNFTSEVVNAHLPLAADVEDDIPTTNDIFEESEEFETEETEETVESEESEESEETEETEETEEFETEESIIKDSEIEEE